MLDVGAKLLKFTTSTLTGFSDHYPRAVIKMPTAQVGRLSILAVLESTIEAIPNALGEYMCDPDKIDDEHPTHNIFFYVVHDHVGKDPLDLSEESVRSVASLVQEIGRERNWLLKTPVFVDETREQRGRRPIRVLGGVYETYLLFPPWRDKMPVSCERQLFEDLEFIVSKLEEFTANRDVEFAITLQGEIVGRVYRGKGDPGVRDSLLGEWRKVLEERESNS